MVNWGKKMMSKIKIILCVVIMFCLTGCQLARQEEKQLEIMDKLIGVYVTTNSYYDNDNLINIAMQKEVDGQIRYYGTNIMENGYRTADFTGFTGLKLFSVPIVNDQDEIGTDVISEGDIQMTITSDVYLDNTNSDVVGVYVNPVYMDSDGGVYLLVGTGHFMTARQKVEYTNSIDVKTVREVDGNTITDTTTYITKVHDRGRTQLLKVLEMSDDDKVLAVYTFDTENMPTNLKIGKDVEYIVVREYDTNSLDAPIENQILIKGRGGIQYFKELFPGMLEAEQIALDWEQ